MILLLKILLVSFIIISLALLLMRIFAPTMLLLPYSGLLCLVTRNPPFMKPEDYFPEHKILKDNWEKICEELKTVLQERERIPMLQEVDDFQKVFAFKDKIPWRTFIFNAMGNWVPENCEFAPYTSSLLKQIPGLANGLFSIMEGNKYIPPHFGMNRSFVRYHLGLVIPEDAPSYLVVKNQKYFYRPGDDIMFDDTYWHEAKNESNSPRAILFVDILRDKDLPRWLRNFNKKFFAFISKQDRLKVAVNNARMK